MATVKKSKVFKKAEDGVSADYKERQGNYPKEGGKTPPNKFPEAKAPETKKAQTFSQAFAAARKAGDKTFKWNGKSYTTQTKEEATKAKPAAKVETKPATPAAKPSTPAAKAPEKKAELKPETAFTLKKATGQQLVERAKAVVPPSVYTRPGKGTSKPLGNRPPAKSAAQKFGGKTKKK